MNRDPSFNHLITSSPGTPESSDFDDLKNIPFAGTPQPDPKTASAMQDIKKNALSSIKKHSAKQFKAVRGEVQDGFNHIMADYYPEIYSEVDPDEVERKVARFANKIDKDVAWDIMDTFSEMGYVAGCNHTTKVISKILGLKTPPRVRHYYHSKETTADAAYNRNEHTIDIYHPGDQDTISQHETGYDEIDLIAHETFHAYQANKAVQGKGEAYRINEDYYMDPNRSGDDYYAQLLEQEAYCFGHTVADRCKEVRLSSRDVVTEFKRRVRRSQRPKGTPSNSTF